MISDTSGDVVGMVFNLISVLGGLGGARRAVKTRLGLIHMA